MKNNYTFLVKIQRFFRGFLPSHFFRRLNKNSEVFQSVDTLIENTSVDRFSNLWATPKKLRNFYIFYFFPVFCGFLYFLGAKEGGGAKAP